MAKDKFSRMAFAKVYQAVPAQDAGLTAISNRVALLEGEMLSSRLKIAENTIELLQSDVASLQALVTKLVSHTHQYDDSGTTKTTQAPTL